ncbi:MAG: hypothetical protein HY901_36620 [Deltaproteobacteria bacterium]|nr:hypothetical protein [Deltaproteobacteria bacterium]
MTCVLRNASLLALLALGCGGGSSDGSVPAVEHPHPVDGAYAWRQVDAPRGDFVQALQALPDGHLWIAGREIRHFDGSSFETLPAPPDTVATDFVSVISASSATDLWTAGSRLLHFDGATWVDRGAELPNSGTASSVVEGFSLARAPSGVWVFRSSTNEASRLTFGFLDGTGFQALQFSPNDPFYPFAGMTVLADGSLAVPGMGVLAGIGSQWQNTLRHGETSRTNGLWALSDAGVFYSWTPDNAGGIGLTSATSSTQFATVATVPLETLKVAGLKQTPVVGDGSGYPNLPSIDVVAVAATSTGALYACVVDDHLFPFTVFISLNGTSAELLSDRLVGVRAARMALHGTALFVVDVNGAVYQGTHR